MDTSQQTSTTIDNNTDDYTSQLIPNHNLYPDELPALVTLNLAADVISVVGNGILIVCVFKYASLHKSKHYIIASLSISDMLCSALYLPFHIDTASLYFTDTNLLTLSQKCVVYSFISFFLTCTGCHLFAIAVERYIAILHPVSYLQFAVPRKTTAVLTVVWLLALVNSGIFILSEHAQSGLVCRTWIFHPALLVLFMLFYVIPYVTVVILYVIIWRSAMKRLARVRGLQSSSNVATTTQSTSQDASVRLTEHGQAAATFCTTTLANVQREHKTTSAIGILLVLFVLSYVCISVSAVANYLCGDCFSAWFLELSLFFLSVQAALNPVVYALRVEQYRNAYLSLIKCH